MWWGLEDKIFNTSCNENNIAIYLHYNQDNSDNRNITYRHNNEIERIQILHQLKFTGWVVHGSNPSWSVIFLHLSTPATYTNGSRSFPGTKQLGCGIKHPSPPGAEVRQSTATSLFLLSAFITDYGMNFTFTFLPLSRVRSSLHLLIFLYTSAYQSSQSQWRLHKH